ncbi:hypothetical protein ANCDUO_04549 [Ancylostoma duodenale]|uniref:Uncharacterized protein n=1 Tax=Ancylostoma duodenale TaxID=51022 RepID=A0A0C2H6Q7_9BILA|nr:hypothetical protein ANCDUO_04549 [Ancylostoma duodenale]
MFDRLCGCCRHEASSSDDVIRGEEERRLRANDRVYNSQFKYAFIPQISSISWYSTAIPLVIVLAFSAVKDGYDDVRAVPKS